jgi:outer membrane protein assembly factor BamA
MTCSIRRLGSLCAAMACSLPPAIAQIAGAPIPSFPELEAAGAVIGDIRIDNRNIFDLDDPREDGLLYRLANALHVRTRPGLLLRSLLFKSGERLSARLIEESERLLRADHNIYDVRIRPVAYRDGVVDIEVMTRDTWTLDPAIKLSREGGVNTGGIGLKESNFLGTGLAIGYTHESEVDRSGSEFSIGHPNLFGSWTGFEYNYGNLSDGRRESFRLERPFYALDARWAAGLSAATVSRIDSIFSGERLVGQYRRRSEVAEVHAGWSKGLVDRWTHRYSVGLQYEYDTYHADPALPAPPGIPPDRKVVAPFIRYEVVEDDYRKVRNRDRVERTEYLPLGFQSRLQLGRAMTGLGSTRELWVYSALASGGLEFAGDQALLAEAHARGRYGGGGGENQFFGGSARYYYPQGRRALLFASLAADAVIHGDASEQLALGGGTGLRGYPLRYQTGTHRAVLTVEQRIYTEWFPFSLFRIGAAAFFDVGRAWGDATPGAVDRGWLRDAGIGLRVFSDRSATGRVLHIDLAFPLDSDPAIRSWQLYFRSKARF